MHTSRSGVQVQSQVQDLVSVLETAVLPVNRHTRRTGDLRGSSLYMPGVIRAAATNWEYKKIWAQKNKGGRRDHHVALLVDVSLSM